MLAQLAKDGYQRLLPGQAAAIGLDVSGLTALRASWDDLPRDRYLRDGGAYRARRHSCYIESLPDGQLTLVPHRPHWQPTSYNALHGGLTRWFDPISRQVLQSTAFQQLVGRLGQWFAQQQPVQRWYVEAHQFRIDTEGGIGRPTPEGAHRDGVDFVAVILAARQGVRGGETRVFPTDGASGVRFTMHEPWSMLLLNDARVVHETTPIQASGAGPGWRDTLVLTYRAGGFQAPASADL